MADVSPGDYMKVAVSATEDNLDAQIDPRFGRCPYFIIVDTESLKFEAIPNTSANASTGAGIQAAQAVTEKGVEAVITGSVGPSASQTLSASGIKIITGAEGIVRDSVMNL
jgi:predicted Fe-Mo cluster-binding NifX family protein